MKTQILGVLMLALFSSTGLADDGEGPKFPVQKTDAEWREQLTPLQYSVARQKGTERAFTGTYLKNKKDGVYPCIGCGAPLFHSENKFESGCGWPSFDQEHAASNVVEKVDRSHGMVRTEIVCGQCGSHLGHVFNDGPRETTGKRYCVNSASVSFEEAEPERRD